MSFGSSKTSRRYCWRVLIFLSVSIFLTISKTQFSAIGSAIIAISVIILNQIYNQIAIVLNRYENHLTETNYNDSLAAKTFLFQFVNSYTSFYYIAFFKNGYFIKDASGEQVAVGGWKLWGSNNYIDTCQSSDPRTYGCMPELTTNILITLLVNMFVSQLVEFVLPYVLRYVSIFFRNKNPHFAQTREKIKDKPWEVQSDYVPNVSTFDDYNELSKKKKKKIQFSSFFPSNFYSHSVRLSHSFCCLLACCSDFGLG